MSSEACNTSVIHRGERRLCRLWTSKKAIEESSHELIGGKDARDQLEKRCVYHRRSIEMGPPNRSSECDEVIWRKT